MRIWLADDQAQVRSALRLLLEQREAIKITGEAADVAELLLLADTGAVDVILLDWELPGLPAGRLVSLLRRKQPAGRIVALSSRPEARAEALAAGVDGFVGKTEPPEQVVAAVAEARPLREVS